jgi:2,4-dienoyl-CoA reductase-like NADH-dependent reductase (Old Yellow Enzyme family)
VAPSPLAFSEGEEVPIELDKTGVEKIKADFKAAAARALKAGFKVIEIHAAHGYLIHEFYSPLSNHRTDEYGGSFENRIRLLLEIVAAVKESWPAEKPLFVRISSTDWTEGGWTADDSVKLARILKEAGVDLIDCSSGGNAFAKIPLKPGYQVEFAERIRKESDILTGAVGLIVEAAQADGIIRDGQADMVLLAREMLRDPYFPLRAAHKLGQEIEWPIQYERARW